MPNPLSYQVIEEIGTVFSSITTANGYSLDIGTVAYAPGDTKLTLADNAPMIEFYLQDWNSIDIDNNTQEITLKFEVLATIERLVENDISKAGQLPFLNFAADIKTALYTIYDRQAAGTFPLDNFRLLRSMEQEFAQLTNKTIIFTVFQASIDALFSER